jgi:hypothetical protein
MISKKTNKIKTFLSNLIGVNDWKLNGEGHLNISADELNRLTTEYGADFVGKFEKLLSEENEHIDLNINQNHLNMPKELKLALLCALLSVDAFSMSNDGTVTLKQDQLEKIEAGLKKLQEEKNTAVNALNDASKAMDDLDVTVKAAETPSAKVEAIRAKLALKPGVGASGILSQDEHGKKKIEGADEVSEYVKTIC